MLYTPGSDKMGPPNVVRFDEQIQNEYNDLQVKRRDLQTRLNNARSETEQTETNIGGFVAMGCDVDELADRWHELTDEIRWCELAIRHIDNQVERLKRVHFWLVK